jgi:hypothetical protein
MMGYVPLHFGHDVWWPMYAMGLPWQMAVGEPSKTLPP